MLSDYTQFFTKSVRNVDSSTEAPSPFAFPALSAPILRRTIAARIRTVGVHRERITITICALKKRDPQLGASME